MTKTIQAALSPLLIIGSFCGLSFFEYPLGRPWPYLTSIYLLITWSLYAYFYYYLIYIGSFLFRYLSWQGTIVMFNTIVSMLVNLFRFKELKMCLRKLSSVDDTLKMLGIPKEYRRLYNNVIRLSIGWIILNCLIIASDTIGLKCDCFMNCILVPLMGNYLLCINTFNGIIWGTILRYIDFKFQQINKYIYNILEDKTDYFKKLQKIILIQRTEAIGSKQLIWIIMHVHLELSQISRIWNKVFSVQIILQMISCFALFISSCRDIYVIYIIENENTEHTEHEHTFKEFLYIMAIYFWVIICNANLLILNCICQSVCNEANETVAILYKLSNDSFDKNLRKQILQFILQIKQREIKFSSMGTYFGYNFIRRFYMSAVTVVVLIVQMHIIHF